MKRLLLALFVLGNLLPLPAVADIVVVVGATSPVAVLSRNEVVNIFLGRFRELPSGISAQPIDLPATHPDRDGFYRQLVGRTPAEMSAYWARLVFSGRTWPPIQTDRFEDAVGAVQNIPGGIGYMDRSKVGGRLKIVFEFTQ
jgi:ABC-type phosphate transport system substrate-binding protein